MQRHLTALLAVLLLSATLALPALADESFPLREKFPKVKYVTTDEVNQEYGKLLIVDVRSKLEFDVVHVKKALHIPVALATFTKELENARSKTGKAKIVFYCNGHTCAKAYEAADIATEAGFQNVFAYDAGIHEWVNAHPEKSTLMGKSPAPKEMLIPKSTLLEHKLKFADFKAKAQGENVVVIDIREPFQRQEIPDLPKMRNIPSDRLVQLLASHEFKGKQLLIFDAVGKQVEWLQYYLVNYGYKNYSFLDSGVLSAKEAGALKQ